MTPGSSTGSTRRRSRVRSRGWCSPPIEANESGFGGGFCGRLLGSAHQRVGDSFHDRLLVRADRATGFALESPRDHVVNHLLDGPGPLVGEDVRQLVERGDVVIVHELTRILTDEWARA